MAKPFFTIGHSTRTLTDFAELLAEAEIAMVVDVRAFPRSRTNPQFNLDTLPAALAARDLRYEHIPELGGRRRKVREVVPELNAFWRVQSFHNYADYALGDAFRLGFARLRALGHKHRCAIMCSEAVWWRCHRRIIADHLIAAGETVFHILDHHHIEPAQLTTAARLGANQMVTYPADAAAIG